MKPALLILLLGISIASAQFRTVQGTVYSLTDPNAGWTTFSDPKRVIGFVQPNGIEVQCFHYETDIAGLDHLNGGIYRRVTDTHCVMGDTVILVNYPFMKRYNRGDVILDIVYAMRVQNLGTTVSGPRRQTAMSGDFNENISSHTEFDTADQVFDCGTPWTPPVKVLSMEQRNALDEKTFHWLQSQATNGSVSAAYSLGEHYLNGIGTDPDKTNAVFWLQRAADSGSIESSNLLAKISVTNAPAQ